MADRARVLAHRVAAHQFDRTETDPAALRVFDLGVQDSERSARAALAARLETPPDLATHPLAADPLAPNSSVHNQNASNPTAFTLTWSVRGAPHWHRSGEVPGLAARLWPLSDGDALARMNRPRGVTEGREVLRAVATALRSVVTGPTTGTAGMTKGEASARLTPLAPPEVTAWCRGCDATHVQDPVFRLAVLPAGLRFDPAQKTVTFRELEQREAVPAGTRGFTSLISAYLALHGPAGPSEVAHYFGAPVRDVKAVWPDDLVEVTPKAWLPADRVPAFDNPPEPDLVRLLPPLDPYLNARDRDLLVPDEAHRKEVWRILGRPGAIMVDGEILGTWRARTAGRRLDVRLLPFAPLDLDRFTGEAHRLALARGLAEARIS